ncbi:MAG: hypothetical protein JKY14_13745 [Paraglaciecola sp.]|nr:hypothetical protein [Paraglaciecola sp.]
MSYPLKTGLGLGLGLAVTGKSMGLTTADVINRNFRIFQDQSSVDIPAITLGVGSSLSINASPSSIDRYTFVSGAGSRVQTREDGVILYSYVNSQGAEVYLSFGTLAVEANVFSSLKLTWNLNSITARLNGVTEIVPAPLLPDVVVSRIGANISGIGVVDNFNGVLSDVVIYDGTIKRSYAIDDGGDLIVDTVSGENGVVFNGSAANWGSFFVSDVGWKGLDLSVPPWASSDQELVNAILPS